METSLVLKEKIYDYLSNLRQNLQDEIETLKKEDLRDEINLTKIKLNVVNIYYDMVKISYNDDIEKFNVKYLSFFEKIPKSWYANKEKAKKFGDKETIIIEDLKLSTMESIKTEFISLYEKLT